MGDVMHRVSTNQTQFETRGIASQTITKQKHNETRGISPQQNKRNMRREASRLYDTGNEHLNQFINLYL